MAQLSTNTQICDFLNKSDQKTFLPGASAEDESTLGEYYILVERLWDMQSEALDLIGFKSILEDKCKLLR